MFRCTAVASLLVTVGLIPTFVRAQGEPLPPAPVPVQPSPAPILGRPVPLPPNVQPSPLTYQPAPPPVIVPGVTPPPLDPGPDGWGPLGISASEPPGWFVGVDVAYVFPVLKFRLTNDVPLPNTGLQLNVPAVSLDNTVSPVFELGYRLPESAGLFALSYSFLLTEGTGQTTNAMGTFDVKTRAQVNWGDLDYGVKVVDAAPRWDVSWRLGVRIVDVFFDSSASNPALSQSSSNEFFGAGPHARFDVERRIVPIPGLALFGRADGAVFVGKIEQTYRATVGGISDSLTADNTQTVPYLNLQAGLSYAPPAFPGFKLTTGYLFERYFNAGRLGSDASGSVSDSRGDLWWQGVFLRGQYDF